MYMVSQFMWRKDLFLEKSADSYTFLNGFTSLSVLLLFPLLITLLLCMVFDSISSNIDQVLDQPIC